MKNHSKLTASLFRFALLIVAGAITLGEGSATAAGNRDLWRSDESAGHYFLKDNQHGTYVETIDCQVAYTFKFSPGSTTGLRLYDASRNLYVELQNGTMWLKNPGAPWQKFRKGRFDQRVTFNHVDQSGGITGAIWKKDACGWSEYQDGTANPTFRFKETSTNDSEIVMYDHSRFIYVRLLDTSMYLRQGFNGGFTFFKKGGWY